MENTGITWYSNGYGVWLDNINPNRLKTALRNGLKKSLRIVQKEAKNNLKRVTPRYNSGRKGKSADFRLKWFENGTQSRFTKNGWHRGKMKSSSFFNSAIETTKSEVESSLEGNYEEALQKAYNKFIINSLKK